MELKESIDELKTVLRTNPRTCAYADVFEKNLIAPIEKAVIESEKQKKLLDILKSKIVFELDKRSLSLKQYEEQYADYTIIFFDTDDEYNIFKEWLDNRK